MVVHTAPLFAQFALMVIIIALLTLLYSAKLSEGKRQQVNYCGGPICISTRKQTGCTQ